jgi:hypothetical protein
LPASDFDAIITANTEYFQEDIVSVSIRPLLVPGVALAAAGAVALGPSVVVPSAMTPARPVADLPAVQMAEVQLAGFAQDLYYALEGWVEFGVQVLQDFFFWNPEISAQIGTLYTTLQPIVERVVILVTNLIEGPADILGTLTGFASGIFGIGLPAFTAASTGAAAVASPLAATRAGDGPRGAAAVTSPAAPAGEAAPEVAPEATVEAAPEGAPTEAATEAPAAEAPAAEAPAEVTPVEVSVPAAVSRAERGRAARTARQPAAAAAAVVAEPATQAVAEVSAAAPSTETRSSSTRASRGAAGKAAKAVRSAAKAG